MGFGLNKLQIESNIKRTIDLHLSGLSIPEKDVDILTKAISKVIDENNAAIEKSIKELLK
ncbi:hypothetical protein M5X00_17315 [Paenibacillus alvei]|uniref:hypothetical protein n=1 Tax=Paenibacillus alvei TaxID=44250 RepID=UPI0002897E4E|nr:hypothetical protein [Paenibacillus alvei]EJW19186.1 hypothetical protein PAV_1c01570 [Paenibacillus alvei DSM 29]MCY9544225.1 hypothetical protein [Paenibacillus alvei]MCY9706349.1 hypothetical protein [Paenibacillus alvei]MCY9732215.1 hypothetical protein [Paenibacillus alvei]MCY9755999.1 hypothetical protein [Paenibacillus alvei]